MSKGKASLEEICKKDIEMLNRLTPKDSVIGNEPVSSPEQRSSETIKKTLRENNESSNKYSRNANIIGFVMMLIALVSFIFTYTSNNNFEKELSQLKINDSIKVEEIQKLHKKILHMQEKIENNSKIQKSLIEQINSIKTSKKK